VGTDDSDNGVEGVEDDLSVIGGTEFAAELSSAIEKHRRDHSNPVAKLSRNPMPEDEAAEMADSMGSVSGYRALKRPANQDLKKEELLDLLASSLTDLPLANVHFEIVWSLGDVAVIYIRGEERRDV
jgi:hypothetical protein